MNDPINNRAIIMGYMLLEKFNEIDMKQYILKKTKIHFKMRSKLVKILGIYFYKEMSEEEWKSK